MNRSWRSAAGAAAIVLAAMAVGRAITETVPVGGVDDRPFVHHAAVGSTARLEYADVTVTGVRSAHQLLGAGVPSNLPAGVFLVVDTTFVARGTPQNILGVRLQDTHGRWFAPTSRGNGCPQSTVAPTGVTWYAMWCFDVPQDALAGAHLIVARGDYGIQGSGQRRDDQVDVDLGIDQGRAAALGGTRDAYTAQRPAPTPLPTATVPPVKES